MNKILIICKAQFGYHTDIYKWCEYLRDEYNVEVITFDGNPKVAIDGVTVHYVSNIGSRTLRGIRYILKCLWHLMFYKGVIMVCYFRECRLLKWFLPWKKMILDIRTLDVSNNKEIRQKEDSLIIKATKLYDFVTIISEGLRQKISLSIDKSAILPLGADVVSTTKKSYDSIRMLYVGTLFNRDVYKTIHGLAIVLARNQSLDIHYDIVGDSHGNELNEIKQLVIDYGLEDYVTLHGYIQHSQLKTFFDKCNIGVSFVPMTEYYEYQPVTKSFEYILSGLYTLATNTYSNKEIITEANGYLINDTAESVAEGIEYIINNKTKLNSIAICRSLRNYQWKNILDYKLKPILKKYQKNEKSF